ncbi:hypothetical protein F2Q69_00019991 [Brassica cretica]|uniref:Uncharacterized protein n=1 Tax=Brassica cretica TaxID=69181 RepID=A0A8S9QAV6_BRACR|nr:hypothetical protein F2Q69_00019991 [Brassica cretica]
MSDLEIIDDFRAFWRYLEQAPEMTIELDHRSILEEEYRSMFTLDHRSIAKRAESTFGIGVPHGVPGDIWVHLELNGGDYSDLWMSTAWRDFPERLHEVTVTHIPERPGQSDIERSLAFLSRDTPPRATFSERHGEVARVSIARHPSQSDLARATWRVWPRTSINVQPGSGKIPLKTKPQKARSAQLAGKRTNTESDVTSSRPISPTVLLTGQEYKTIQ